VTTGFETIWLWLVCAQVNLVDLGLCVHSWALQPVSLPSFLSLTRPYHSSFPPFLRLGQRTFVVQCAKMFTYPPDPSETSGRICAISGSSKFGSVRHPHVVLLVMAEPPSCEAGVTAHETQVFFNAWKRRMLKQYQSMHGSSGCKDGTAEVLIGRS